jgi:hypothetical protein
MPSPTSPLSRLLAVLAGVVVMAGATAAVAQASYGELGHFGEKGTGAGDFNPGESHPIGVDPTDNSVYVVDQPNPSRENEFRIQKFEATEPGKYKVVASATFTPRDDEGAEEPDLVEGVAVDPKLKRVYVLASEIRRPERVSIDQEETAASEVYAWSTQQSGSKLLPATSGEEGLFVSTKVLRPLSNKLGQSLIEPEGIAVDEHEHDDLLILASEETASEEPVNVVQQITENGELGKRWSDQKDILEDEATSPAVSSSGHIYVDVYDQIDEVPASFSDTTEPTPLPGADFNNFILQEELTEFPGQPEPESGGALSVGEEGTIYTKAGITRQFNGTKFRFPGIIEFNSAGEEEGWTGGQSAAAVGTSGPCKLSLTPAIEIAAGKEHDVFAYDSSTSPKTTGPRVVEFGPGGSGCASAEATPAEASVNGQPVAAGEEIPIEDKVTLSSIITQANALSVQWKFGDGTEETIKGRQFQHIEVTHKFVKAGELQVTAIIHTDDLADPEVEIHGTVDVIGPEATTGTPEKVEETSAVLTGTVNPNGAPVKECFFQYGTTQAYGSTVQCEPKASELKGEKPVAVKASVASLAKATDYDYRLVVKYLTSGESAGANQTFATTGGVAGPKPTVLAGQASPIGKNTATLNATVDPNGIEVSECKFLYGTSSLTNSVACKPSAHELGAGTTAVQVSAAITGLAANTSYKFAIVARNANGEEKSEGSFATEKEETGGGNSNNGNGGGGNNNGNSGNGGGGNGQPQGEGGVLPNQESKPPVEPIATLAGSPTTVGGGGAFTVKIICPIGETACIGTITLKTLKAVVASAGIEAKSKAAVLTLAGASFNVPGGKTASVTLHLSSKGRALLARAHSVSARVTIVAHDSAGKTHTATAVVTLRPAKKAAKHH